MRIKEFFKNNRVIGVISSGIVSYIFLMWGDEIKSISIPKFHIPPWLKFLLLSLLLFVAIGYILKTLWKIFPLTLVKKEKLKNIKRDANQYHAVNKQHNDCRSKMNDLYVKNDQLDVSLRDAKEELKLKERIIESLKTNIQDLKGEKSERNMKVNCFNDSITRETTATIAIRGRSDIRAYVPDRKHHYKIEEEHLGQNVIALLKEENGEFGILKQQMGKNGGRYAELYKKGDRTIPKVFR